MKHKYIESLLSEIELLASKVENLKENKRVPFSFFKESFKLTQEISRLLHELEFGQIEEMRGEMEKLVQYLSDSEKTKKEAEDKAKYLAAKVKEVEIESEKEKEKEEEIVETKDVIDETEIVEKVKETSVVKEDQEASSPIVENKDQQQEEEEIELAKTEDKSFEESPLQAIPTRSTLLNSKSEKILADIVPKNKSLNDVQPVSQTLQDSKPTISLNDRFLFQRELFDNNRDAMNTMLTKLQAFSSFDLVESYLKRNTTWDFSDETVAKFLQMLKDRF